MIKGVQKADGFTGLTQEGRELVTLIVVVPEAIEQSVSIAER